ncbi:hypothetical protein AB0F15_10075 [Amycolatopsis sp. NPDC026612]|uniref:hypothetical protein n=1 Tax=Amycolatopsis sp. NPDC026612 TaxID=3155466 RepID=UPI00340C6ED8
MSILGVAWRIEEMMNARISLVTVVIVLTGAVVAACTPDPLDVTCEKYLSLGEAEQLDLAALWGTPTRDHVDATGRIVAPRYRSDLLGYCRTHSDDKLKDLELTFR